MPSPNQHLCLGCPCLGALPRQHHNIWPGGWGGGCHLGCWRRNSFRPKSYGPLNEGCLLLTSSQSLWHPLPPVWLGQPLCLTWLPPSLCIHTSAPLECKHCQLTIARPPLEPHEAPESLAPPRTSCESLAKSLELFDSFLTFIIGIVIPVLSLEQTDVKIE